MNVSENMLINLALLLNSNFGDSHFKSIQMTLIPVPIPVNLAILTALMIPIPLM